MKLSIIVAIAKNRVIGFENSMPWHLPADLAWFKQNTINKSVIMGRKTFESIGRPLPNRHNIVISKTKKISENPMVTWVTSLEEALDLVKNEAECFIIGGGNIYQQALHQIDKLYLTHIDAEVQGDTFFPDYSVIEWESELIENHYADEKNPYNYRFEILQRRTSKS